MAINSDKILNPKTIFWFLVALGAALRIGSLWGPLSHDELSAIVRLNFDTFPDLIDLWCTRRRSSCWRPSVFVALE